MALTPPNAAEYFALGLGDGAMDAHLDELDVPRDRVERRPQLMAHRRQEVALRAIRHLRFPPRRLRVPPRTLGGILREHLVGDLGRDGDDARHHAVLAKWIAREVEVAW